MLDNDSASPTQSNFLIKMSSFYSDPDGFNVGDSCKETLL